jgi:hypothetical protein
MMGGTQDKPKANAKRKRGDDDTESEVRLSAILHFAAAGGWGENNHKVSPQTTPTHTHTLQHIAFSALLS